MDGSSKENRKHVVWTVWAEPKTYDSMNVNNTDIMDVGSENKCSGCRLQASRSFLQLPGTANPGNI